MQSQIIAPLLAIISFSGMVVMTVAYFKMQSKLGAKNAEKDLNTTTQEVIATYKEQVSQLKEQIEKYRLDMHNMTDQFGQLKGVMSEKDKTISEMRDILSLRKPEMDKFFTEILPIMSQIKEFMSQINEHMKK